MKLSCEKHVLQDAISIASRAVSPRSALPVLEGLLLEATASIPARPWAAPPF